MLVRQTFPAVAGFLMLVTMCGCQPAATVSPVASNSADTESDSSIESADAASSSEAPAGAPSDPVTTETGLASEPESTPATAASPNEEDALPPVAAPAEVAETNPSDEGADGTVALDLAPAETVEVSTLSIGDDAPALSVGGWVLGDAVEEFASDHVYVVEFWATWCPPCLRSMPHLSDLQTKFQEQVTMIGLTNEDEGTVADFFAEGGRGASMNLTYRIALDDSSQSMTANYMRAAQQNGIPTAFIVGKTGQVEWIGHPMSMDEPLEQVVNGTWDRDAAQAALLAEQKRNELMQRLGGLARSARASGDFTQLFAVLDDAEAEGLDPKVIGILRYQIHKMWDNTEALVQFISDSKELFWDDSNVLNGFSWDLVTSLDEPESELAMSMIQRAAELTDYQDASIIDTLARVHFTSGEIDQAIEWQRKAVELGTDDGQLAQSIGDALDEYLAAKAAAEGGDTAEESESTDEEAETEAVDDTALPDDTTLPEEPAPAE